MQCKICLKIFTPQAKKKITQICSKCDERISQNNSERNEDSFENITHTESKKYYNEQMNILDRQIKNIEEKPYIALENLSNFNQEESFTIIERLRSFKYHKPNSKEPSKSSKLAALKIKYPYVESLRNPFRDRDQYKQYWKLVSTKDLKVAEFVLKWEHEHEKRIHKDMAWELLTEIKEKGEVLDEFLEGVHKKYEYYG
jgi:hypothetical protein